MADAPPGWQAPPNLQWLVSLVSLKTKVHTIEFLLSSMISDLYKLR